MSKKKVKLDIDWGLIFFISFPELVIFFCVFALAIKYWWITFIALAIGVGCYFAFKKNKVKNAPKIRTAEEIILDCENLKVDVARLEFNTYLKSLNGLILKTDNGDSSYNRLTFDDSGFVYSYTSFNLEYMKSFRVYKYDGMIESWEGLVCIKIIINKPWESFDNVEEIRFSREYQENAIKLYEILQKTSALRDEYLTQKEIERELFAQQESSKLAEAINSVKFFAIEKNFTETKRNKIEDFPEVNVFKITRKFNKNDMLAYVVLQIKTTNESVSQNGKITEIAALKYVEGEPYEKFIAKISTEKQTNTYTIDEIRQPLLSFIGNCNLISYDIIFCLKFLFVYGFDKLINKKRKYFSVLSYLDFEYEKKHDLYSASNYRGIFYDKENLICSCYAIDKLLEKAVEDLEWKDFEKENRY